MTPEATARAIEAAEAENAYVAIHVGTSELPRSDLDSLRQALELSQGRRLHVCHVCTCCLGLVLGNPLQELQEMMKMLAAHPNVVSESHLSVQAYSFAHFRDGMPSSHSTQMFLEIAGYSLDEAGLRQGMLDGYASAVVERDGENIFLQGEEGYSCWKDGLSQALGFRGNLPVSLFVSATHKGVDGDFTVDALASDGGGIPRNNLLTLGAALVHLGAMTFSDLAVKLAVAPARMYGLRNKGHLKQGADADVTVIDPESGRAFFSASRGRILLRDGEPVGEGANLITTTRKEGVGNFDHVTQVETFFH